MLPGSAAATVSDVPASPLSAAASEDDPDSEPESVDVVVYDPHPTSSIAATVTILVIFNHLLFIVPSFLIHQTNIRFSIPHFLSGKDYRILFDLSTFFIDIHYNTGFPPSF